MHKGLTISPRANGQWALRICYKAGGYFEGYAKTFDEAFALAVQYIEEDRQQERSEAYTEIMDILEEIAHNK